MAIQNRRGIYSDFDPTKMVEGEFAVVQSGDPNTSDGKAVYIAPTTGTAERVALYKDLQQEVQGAITDATDEVIQEVTAGIIEGVAEDVTKAETAATNAEQSAQEAQEVLENKAEKDGYYPDLYAGNLTSTRKQTDTVPYLMRKTGGDLSRIGEREDDTLVGATVNVNQLVQNGDFADGTAGWSITATATVSNNVLTVQQNDNSTYVLQTWKTIEGHKYLFVLDVNAPEGRFTFNSVIPNLDATGSWQKYCTIRNASSTGNEYFVVRVMSSAYPVTWQMKNVNRIDLTDYFNSASIADYLYNLETATAGAGVAKLKEWGFFTGEYIPYNSGTLESVEARSHVMRGFNQWDEEWEEGRLNNGVPSPSTNQICSKNFCPILPNITYYGTCGKTDGGNQNIYYLFIAYYDESKTWISNAVINNVTFTTPSNAAYFKIYTNSSTVVYGNTYTNDICINLSSDRNGEYEPYSAHTYDLDDSLTLRGIPKLDSNNDLYYDGDTYESDGTVTRRYGVVDLGTLDWTESSGLWSSSSFANMPTIKAMTCSGYVYAGTFSSNAELLNIADKSIGCHTSVTDRIFIKDTSFADAAAFKAAMSGVMLVYELATPTTEQSTPFTNPQICDPDGTEEYMTNNGIPVGHETEYDYDIKGLAEELIDVPDVPSNNGTYVLKATRSAGGISYEWVSEA